MVKKTTSTTTIHYLGAHTRLSLLVLLVCEPLVQLAPKCFGFPRGHLVLQTAVEGDVLQGVQPQLSAHDVEGLQCALTGRRLRKVLKQLHDQILRICRHVSHCSRVGIAELSGRRSAFLVGGDPAVKPTGWSVCKRNLIIKLMIGSYSLWKIFRIG